MPQRHTHMLLGWGSHIEFWAMSNWQPKLPRRLCYQLPFPWENGKSSWKNGRLILAHSLIVSEPPRLCLLLWVNVAAETAHLVVPGMARGLHICPLPVHTLSDLTSLPSPTLKGPSLANSTRGMTATLMRHPGDTFQGLRRKQWWIYLEKK